jgi:glycosyltransferase involved in cell wall biosynthesis
MKNNILFLLKKSGVYGAESSGISRSGLLNSATITAEELESNRIAHTGLEVVVDGNSIDRELYQKKPDICIIEAIWATPEKIAEVQRLHPKVKIIIRVHSEIPFLSNEGPAVGHLKAYYNIPNTYIAFNSESTARDFRKILGDRVLYLPNIYTKVSTVSRITLTGQGLHYLANVGRRINISGDVIHIGCFGAIRPMKNQLVQAFAAMQFADKHNLKLYFHINSARVEQRGEPALKNIRALFDGTNHVLVEHAWLQRDEFLVLVASMGINMQVSLNESFNIVTADSLQGGVPVVVSDTIGWLPYVVKADTEDTETIVNKLEQAIVFKRYFLNLSRYYLQNYNEEALRIWRKTIKQID